MIYGFIGDTSLLSIPAQGTFDWDVIDNGCGLLTDNAKNYFVDERCSVDGRNTRLTIMAEKAVGDLKLHFDLDRLTSAENTAYSNIGADIDFLMNIVEYLELVDGETVTSMDAHLAGDAATFGTFIADSLQVGTSVTTINVKTSTGTESSDIVDWIEFTMVIDSVEISFHLWLKTDSFMTDYPHSTVTKVIYPCDPASFINMSTYSNILEALSESAIYSNTQMDPEVIGSDHSGLVPFQTRYHNTAVGSDYNFSFGILYKGRRPSTMEAITATREALIALSITTTAVWRELFPDLFIDGAFYLVPMWDETYVLPTKTIYTSITNWGKMKSKMLEVFPGYNQTQLDANLELLTNSAAEFQISAISDPSNPVGVTSLKATFPSYVAVDATTPAWNDQTSEDRNFNLVLSDALGVALGGANINGISTEIYEGREWLIVISNFCKIYLLKPASYPV